jgi:hypothetical protein
VHRQTGLYPFTDCHFVSSTLSSEELAAWPDLQKDLSDRFDIPSSLWSHVAQHSSGYFGCLDSKADGHQSSSKNATYGRFLLNKSLGNVIDKFSVMDSISG